MIFYIFILATFYPDDGSDPIAGLAVTQPDGSVIFKSHVPQSIPATAAPILGTLKVTDTNGNPLSTDRGILTPLETGVASFKPEANKNGGTNCILFLNEY